MWQRQIDKSKSIDSKPIYSCTVHHVNGVIVGEGPDVMWGQKHPYGWDKLDQVTSFLYDRLSAEGFTFDEHKRKSLLISMKEKYGSIRLSLNLYDEDITAYKSILTEALEKFPGVAPFFEPSYVDEAEVFVGTEKDFKKWASKLKPGDLERIVDNYRPKPSKA
ncbi:hypothetical protein JXB28_06530 [Candidatus Woesearchaeota archaeon]|nr:hypothetical protein [Candidatus Woesearchaeota archaeon]